MLIKFGDNVLSNYVTVTCKNFFYLCYFPYKYKYYKLILIHMHIVQYYILIC